MPVALVRAGNVGGVALLASAYREPLFAALGLLALSDLLTLRLACKDLRDLVLARGLIARAVAADTAKMFALLERLCLGPLGSGEPARSGRRHLREPPCPSLSWGFALLAGFTLESARACRLP